MLHPKWKGPDSQSIPKQRKATFWSYHARVNTLSYHVTHSLRLSLFSSKSKQSLFQTSAVTARPQRGCKTHRLLWCQQSEKIKNHRCLVLFSSWQIHHKGGGAGVCVCVGKEMGTVFFRAPNQKLAPLPLGGVLPLRRPFLSVWCLCQFLSVSLSFSNLIIRLWTFIAQRPQFVGWAGRRGVTQRVGLGCVGGTERMWLCALFCCGN